MESKSIKIHFLGAAGTVTGSKYLVETIDRKILIDCGLFQGLKELRLKNWETNPIDPSSIDMVLLTHGHLIIRVICQDWSNKDSKVLYVAPIQLYTLQKLF